MLTEALTHKEQVCRLYRSALRLGFDWISDRPEERRFALAVRRQFDLYRSESDPQRVNLLMDAARYLLWEYRHPEPYKCNFSFFSHPSF